MAKRRDFVGMALTLLTRRRSTLTLAIRSPRSFRGVVHLGVARELMEIRATYVPLERRISPVNAGDDPVESDFLCVFPHFNLPICFESLLACQRFADDSAV